MDLPYEDYEAYEDYEQWVERKFDDRMARRKRRMQPGHKPKRSDPEIIATAAEPIGLEGGLQMTYTPSLYEAAWLLESLREFYEQELISDVVALVKGGKEAHVYRCAAHPATGREWLAAKVYRPRMFRSLRNDKQYRQGRTHLAPSGRPVKPNDARLERAVRKQSAFGQQVAHTSWLMHEYTTLELLYDVGAAVPQPLAAAENAILMDYVGDGRTAAPALSEVRLEQQEAQTLYREIVRNIALMLQNGRVHGDLSAYNILYWDGEVTLIDFPQVVYSHVSKGTHPFGSTPNPDAYDILERDITRVCEYFAGQGVRSLPGPLVRSLWQRYVGDQSLERLAEASRWQIEE